MSLGYTVIITRPVEHAAELCAELQRRSIETFSLPLFSFRDLEPTAAREQAVRTVLNLSTGVCVFSSREGVAAFARRFSAPGIACAIAAVGERTARAVQELLGRKADLVPEHASGAELASAIVAQFSPQCPVALITGRDGRSELMDQLTEARFHVSKIELYERVAAPVSAEIVEKVLALPAARTLWTFFSPSAVSGALALGRRVRTHMTESPLLAIGRTTAESLQMQGLAVAILSEAPDVSVVAAAIEAFCARCPVA